MNISRRVRQPSESYLQNNVACSLSYARNDCRRICGLRLWKNVARHIVDISRRRCNLVSDWIHRAEAQPTLAQAEVDRLQTVNDYTVGLAQLEKAIGGWLIRYQVSV